MHLSIASIRSFFTFLIVCLFFLSPLYSQEPFSGSVSLFDGKTLDGWKPANASEAHLWTVEDGLLTGGDGRTYIKKNAFLQTEKEYGDFELRCLFRLSGDTSKGLINSGIQYRSKVVDGALVGYQADIGNGYWGDIYDEHRRGKLVGGYLTVLNDLLEPFGWNSYIVRVKGDRHELYINGVKTADYIEMDSSIPKRGVIAIQAHSGGPVKVQFRDITITEL